MATTRELYLGGAPTNNVDRSAFPSAAFAAGSKAALASTPASHKGPITFGVTRVFDFKNDFALKSYVSEQAAAGTPIIATDVLSAVVIPPGMLFLGISVQVISATATAFPITPKTRVGGLTFPAIAAGTAGLTLFSPPDGVAWVTDGTVDLTKATFNNKPDVLDLTLGTLPSAGFGNLILAVTPILISCTANGYP